MTTWSCRGSGRRSGGYIANISCSTASGEPHGRQPAAAKTTTGHTVRQGRQTNRPRTNRQREHRSGSLPVSYPCPPGRVGVYLCPQLLDAQEQAHSVAHPFDAHLLQQLLVQLQEVLAINFVVAEYLLVLAPLDAPQVLAHPILVPVLDRVGPVGIVEVGLGRAGVVLGRHGGCRWPPRRLVVCGLRRGHHHARRLRAQHGREGLGRQHCHGD